MSVLFDLFLDICLFRKGPQHVPASSTLLNLSVLSYGAAGLLLMLASAVPSRALLLIVLDIALLAGLSYGLLTAAGQWRRFTQTLTALAGTGVLLQLLALPLAIWLARVGPQQPAAALPSLLYLLLLGWSIAVTGHILRHALSIPMALGVLYALGYLIISWGLSDWLAPASQVG